MLNNLELRVAILELKEAVKHIINELYINANHSYSTYTISSKMEYEMNISMLKAIESGIDRLKAEFTGVHLVHIKDEAEYTCKTYQEFEEVQKAYCYD